MYDLFSEAFRTETASGEGPRGQQSFCLCSFYPGEDLTHRFSVYWSLFPLQTPIISPHLFLTTQLHCGLSLSYLVL